MRLHAHTTKKQTPRPGRRTFYFLKEEKKRRKGKRSRRWHESPFVLTSTLFFPLSDKLKRSASFFAPSPLRQGSDATQDLCAPVPFFPGLLMSNNSNIKNKLFGSILGCI